MLYDLAERGLDYLKEHNVEKLSFHEQRLREKAERERQKREQREQRRADVARGAEEAQRARIDALAAHERAREDAQAGADAEPDPVAAREAGERAQVMGRMGTVLETGRLCLCIAADLTFTTGVDHIQSGGAELGYGVKA